MATDIGGVPDFLVFEVACPDHPGRAFPKLMAGKDLLLDQAPNSRFAYIEERGGFTERNFSSLRSLAFPVRCDMTVVAQETHA